jgi:hypothetical protein
VDSGRARDNWYMTLGAPSDKYDPHPDWKRGEAHEPHPIEDFETDGKQPIFITNNALYILFLEDGSSAQAPAGMVAVSVASAEARLEGIIAAMS